MEKKQRIGDTEEERGEFARIANKIRHQLQMTLEELAEKIGISRDHLLKLERGKHVMPAYVFKRILKLKEEAK